MARNSIGGKRPRWAAAKGRREMGWVAWAPGFGGVRPAPSVGRGYEDVGFTTGHRAPGRALALGPPQATTSEDAGAGDFDLDDVARLERLGLAGRPV